MNIWDVNDGVLMIKNRLRYKRILLILDDVNQFNQLEKLAGKLRVCLVTIFFTYFLFLKTIFYF